MMEGGSGPEISIVLPVYNEASNLAPLLQEIVGAMEPLGRTYEVLLVDDGSTDDGPREMADLARADTILSDGTIKPPRVQHHAPFGR